MAILGKWSGNTVSHVPTTSWAAPNGMFPTQDRNDGSAYSFTSSTSTLTLPSSDLADGYLMVAAYEYEDTSNGRATLHGRFIQASGTGTFVSPQTGGYCRDTSEDRIYVRTWGFVDNPSASSTYQFQWQRDADAPTNGTVRSELQVIPLYYSNHGIYSSTLGGILGNTTRNQITGWSVDDESDTTAIELASNIVTLKGDNKRYLIFGGNWLAPTTSGSRTQRWAGLDVDGSQENAAKTYYYYRNSNNSDNGGMYSWIIETATANIDLEQYIYRGDGVSAGQGGADVNGGVTASGLHKWVVLELNDSAEVFRTTGDGGQNLATTGPVDLTLCDVTDIDFNDSASWTRASDTAMNAVVAMDALLGANISAAQNTVTTGSRWTAYSEITVNGTEQTDSFHGNYMRNNQSSQDTFGWSANLLGFLGLSLGDDVGVSVTELAGSEGGGGNITSPSGWEGFWGINLDTLQAGEDVTIIADSGSYAWAGQNANILEALRVSAESGSYAWSGQSAGIIRDLRVSAESGSYAWTGSTADILVDEIISAAGGSYSWAGQNAEILRSLLLSAESGSFSWAGQDAGILKSTPIAADAGSYTWTGADAGIIRDLTISAESGSYSWSGANAGLVRDLLVAAQGATYAWAGDDAGINVSLLIAAEGGSYTWVGQDAALLIDHIIQAAAAGYNWAGQDAAINVAGFTTIIAEAGSYSWAGQDSGLLLDRIINAESGSWTWNGQAANIVLSGAPGRPPQEDFFIGIRIGI